MPEAASYPIMLHLQDRQVAVVGGGPVGERKARHLLRAGARVLLISPALTHGLRTLADSGTIDWIAKAYQRDLLNDYMPILVIAATSDPRVNQTVAQDAQRIRALCNVASGSSELSDFSNMAAIEQPPLTIGVSSNGASPAIASLLKQRLKRELGGEYAQLAQWLGEARAGQGQQPPTQAERQMLYQRIISSDVLDQLRAGECERARQLFDSILAEGAGA